MHLLATTGTAAFIINGLTVHTGLSIKPNASSEECADIAELQKSLEGVDVVVIDEVSMMTTAMLRMVDIRLRQVRGDLVDSGLPNPDADRPFGNFVVLVGDFR